VSSVDVDVVVDVVVLLLFVIIVLIGGGRRVFRAAAIHTAIANLASLAADATCCQHLHG